jgi:serine/threonine protein kinase
MLYKVQYGERTLVLKTLTESAARDAHERLAFAHEAWLAKRVVAKYFAQIIEGPAPSALYFLSTYHGGASLAQRLESGAHFTVPEALRIATGSARAMGALHRRSIVHRDIKPDNLHLGDDGQLRLLDLGVASSGFEVSELAQAQRAGTPSYLAPELFGEGQASAQSDIYAWAVTLYVTLTRRYPYGEVEPFQTPRFADEPTPPTRYRPDIPGWLENILLKALAVSPSARFETAEELLLQLEQGPLSQTPAPKRRPLATRNVLLTWQVIALASLLLNLIMLLVVLRK